MEFDNNKDSTIELLGAVGLFATLGCCIQTLMMLSLHWLSLSMVFIYSLLFLAYLLFIKKKPSSVIFLIVSCVLLFLLQVVFLVYWVILWLPMVLCFFTIIVIAIIYMQELHHYIKRVDVYYKTPVS